jgi:hypothetical protein
MDFIYLSERKVKNFPYDPCIAVRGNRYLCVSSLAGDTQPYSISRSLQSGGTGGGKSQVLDFKFETGGDHDEIRDAVGKLCAQFSGEYWRDLDKRDAYPSDCGSCARGIRR